jgi:hypothetical protein
VDAHLVLVPGLGTLTVGGLAGGDLEGLGAGTVDELLADLLEGGNLAGGQGDTDLVDLLYRGKEAISICSRVVRSMCTLRTTATACN